MRSVFFVSALMIISISIIFIVAGSSYSVTGLAITRPEEIPKGYAAPWDVFNNKNILTASYGNGEISIAAQNTEKVWSTGYYYDPARSEFIQFTFEDADKDIWLDPPATATIKANLAAGKNYVIAYTCKKVDGAWKCGCRTQTECEKWQIQSFDVASLVKCGDGNVDSGEDCDCGDSNDCESPGNLNYKSCSDLGFSSGSLACYPAGDSKQCKYDTSSCTAATCTDSDGDKNPDVKGTVKGKDGVDHVDSCEDANSVKEWYCNSDGTSASEKIKCGSGKSCQDGACIAVSAGRPQLSVEGPSTAGIDRSFTLVGTATDSEGVDATFWGYNNDCHSVGSKQTRPSSTTMKFEITYACPTTGEKKFGFTARVTDLITNNMYKTVNIDSAINAKCGNGIVEKDIGEQCDCGSGNACTSAGLDNKKCSDISSAYTGGTLKCNAKGSSGECMFDISSCGTADTSKPLTWPGSSHTEAECRAKGGQVTPTRNIDQETVCKLAVSDCKYDSTNCCPAGWNWADKLHSSSPTFAMMPAGETGGPDYLPQGLPAGILCSQGTLPNLKDYKITFKNQQYGTSSVQWGNNPASEYRAVPAAGETPATAKKTAKTYRINSDCALLHAGGVQYGTWYSGGTFNGHGYYCCENSGDQWFSIWEFENRIYSKITYAGCY